jgi:hypothetical protein
VYEFAQGALNVVGGRDFAAAGAFQCAPASGDPAHADFGSAVSPFAHQRSTEARDTLLTQIHPAYLQAAFTRRPHQLYSFQYTGDTLSLLPSMCPSPFWSYR